MEQSGKSIRRRMAWLASSVSNVVGAPSILMVARVAPPIS